MASTPSLCFTDAPLAAQARRRRPDLARGAYPPRFALRLARSAASRLSSHGKLHGAGSAAGAIGEILSGTSQRLMPSSSAVSATLRVGRSVLLMSAPGGGRE